MIMHGEDEYKNNSGEEKYKDDVQLVRNIKMIIYGEDESKNDSGEEEYKDDNAW